MQWYDVTANLHPFYWNLWVS